jgi:proline iminopeptidase
MDVRADDNCRLWTATTGHGKPLVMCHGGPGLWDMTGSLAAVLAPRLSVIRWDQLGWAWREPFGRASSARLAPLQARIEELQARGEERAATVLQWSAEFFDGREHEHAEDMATPWFGINHDCYREIWSELQRTWPEDELVTQCRGLEIPVLIIDGQRDLRPRWAVDSLERALPRVTRVILPGVGHIPWLEAPEEFVRSLAEFLL